MKMRREVTTLLPLPLCLFHISLSLSLSLIFKLSRVYLSTFQSKRKWRMPSARASYLQSISREHKKKHRKRTNIERERQLNIEKKKTKSSRETAGAKLFSSHFVIFLIPYAFWLVFFFFFFFFSSSFYPVLQMLLSQVRSDTGRVMKTPN